MYYKVEITYTSKAFGPTKDYMIWERDRLLFPDKEAVEAWLDETYNCKKERIFRDTPDGPIQVGWVFCYKDHCFRQDWVEVAEVVETPVVPKKSKTWRL